jgi:transcription antitermination factor NusG
VEHLAPGLAKDPQYRWYIWYTRPRAEKKINERLLQKGIEVFLPLRRERRQWSDRKKWVDAPLFNGYIFTCISGREWDVVNYTEGIITYVRMEGRPATLRQDQLEEIKAVCGLSESFEVIDAADIPDIGEEVTIKGGPFKGLTAQAVQYRGHQKIAVHIEQLGKVILLELPVRYVQRVRKAA